MKILVLNAGSSSQKCCLYDLNAESLPHDPPLPLWEARTDGNHLKVSTATGAILEETLSDTSLPDAVGHLLTTLWSGPTQVVAHPGEIDIVGHRVVHGGSEYHSPTPINAEVKAAIKRLSPLAPSHNPVALAGIETIEQLAGDVPQIAVFDTAFHTTLPDAAATYAIPYAWSEQGIRRYGFHGINHAYCAGRCAQILERDVRSLRIITCHLGNGCSLCAIREGRSIDTTMGFTPMDGLMMGTRSGAVDPGILLYLLREKGLDAVQLDRILNKESGLKGVSGLSGDMRDIASAIKQNQQRAQLAFDIYVHRLCSEIGAMSASLGGVDALVFTGGVGEHSPPVRAAVCKAFSFLGVAISPEKNESRTADEDISTPESKVRVLVIEAQEDWAIARECHKALSS